MNCWQWLKEEKLSTQSRASRLKSTSAFLFKYQQGYTLGWQYFHNDREKKERTTSRDFFVG